MDFRTWRAVREERSMDELRNTTSTTLPQRPRSAPILSSKLSPPENMPEDSFTHPSLSLPNEARSHDLERLLFEAIQRRDFDTSSSLISCGVPLEFETYSGLTPLVAAILKSDVATTELLLSKGASPHHRSRGLPPLVHAARSCTHAPQLMRHLVSYGAVLGVISGPEQLTVLHQAAAEGWTEAVEWLVQQDGVNVEARCSQDRTALILAAQEGHVEVLRVLLRAGASARAKSDNGGTPLIWGACRGKKEVVNILVLELVDVEARDDYGHTALSMASHFGHAEIVDILIKNGADVNSRGEKPKDFTPLMAAVCAGSVETVKKLIANGADVHATTARGESILVLALQKRNQEIAGVLIEAMGGEEDEKRSVALQIAMSRNHEMTKALTVTASMMYAYSRLSLVDSVPFSWISSVLLHGKDIVNPLAMRKMLQYALQERDMPMIKSLLIRGCEVNKVLDSGHLPLKFAVAKRDVELVKAFLEAGADPNQTVPASIWADDNQGSDITPFDHAILNMRGGLDEEIVDLLLKTGRCRINKGRDVSCTAFSYILRKCKGRDSDDHIVKLAGRMVEATPDVNADRDDNGFTLLHVATYHQDETMVNLLLSRRARTDFTDCEGRTPFLLACEKDPELALKLVWEGSNIAAKTLKTNAGALHIMASHGYFDDSWVTRGLDINEQTSQGYTPLTCALIGGHERTALKLIARGASVTWKTARNHTALHLAARAGLEAALAEILTQEVYLDVDASDAQGWTPLHAACATGTPAVVTKLLDAGADIEQCTSSGNRPLHIALLHSQEDIALLLLRRGTAPFQLDADFTALASGRQTALHLAAEHGLPRAVTALLDLDTSMIRAVDGQTWTPLCRASSAEVVRILIARGADVDYTDKDGWTALHQAVQFGDAAIAEMLVEAGSGLAARTTDDGLTVWERAVRLWRWGGRRRAVRPEGLRRAEMRWERRRGGDVGGGREEGDGLGGEFEVIERGSINQDD